MWGMATEIELQMLAQEPYRKLHITQTQSPETHQHLRSMSFCSQFWHAPISIARGGSNAASGYRR